MTPLILHAGASRVTPEELRAVVTPPGTKTWMPIGHAGFLDTVEREMSAAGKKDVFLVRAQVGKKTRIYNVRVGA